MELTYSWRDAFPKEVQARYRFVETRDASAILAATNPDEFNDIVAVLSAFYIDIDRIVRPGGSKHLIPKELDEAFREFGWREARFEQTLTTRLRMYPYAPAGEKVSTVRQTENEYGGHKIDNVKGRVGLDVEWNPKDGNLDRDLGNFRALYDGGQINVGIILTREVTGMRELFTDTILKAAVQAREEDLGAKWRLRVRKTPTDPLGTSTTSNMDKLVPRIERGDGGGCPTLAIGITAACFVPPPGNDVEAELRRLAKATELEQGTVTLAGRMFEHPTVATADPNED